jgi:hypothetical protein
MYKDIVRLQLLSIFALNLFDGIGLAEYRFIPSTFVSILKIIHVVYYMIFPSEPYPFIFYLERIPEIAIIFFVSFHFLVYILGFIVSGPHFLMVGFQIKTPSFLFFPDLQQDFNYYIRTIGLKLAESSGNF